MSQTSFASQTSVMAMLRAKPIPTRLCDISMNRLNLPHLSTERLLVRPRSAEDLHELQRLHRNPLVTRHARSGDDAEALERKLRRSLERPFPLGRGHWTLLRKDSIEKLIGSAMLITFDDDSSALEAGWHLEPVAWGHGYAQEALSAILAHGLSIPRIARIVALIHRDNDRSQKLAARLGFLPTTVQSGSHGLYEKFSGAPDQSCTSSFAGS